MVSVAIMLRSRSFLHVFERGGVIGVWYRDAVLDSYNFPFTGTVVPDLILMSDNTRPHRDHMVNDFFGK